MDKATRVQGFEGSRIKNVTIKTSLSIFYPSFQCLPDRDTFFFQKRKYPKKLTLGNFHTVLLSMKRGMMKLAPIQRDSNSHHSFLLFIPACRQAGSFRT
jgi:hypothetical protein